MTKIQTILNESSEIVLHSLTAGGIGYLCARAFMSINPVHAAVIAAGSMLVSRLTRPIFDRLFDGPSASHASKLLGSILNITASVGIASSIAKVVFALPLSIPVFLCINAFAVGAFALTSLGITAARAGEAWHRNRNAKAEAVKLPIHKENSLEKNLIKEKLHLKSV